MNQQPALSGLEITTPVFSAGGSQIRISAQGIEVITSGKFEAKAGQHQFLGGEKADISIPVLPKFQNKNWIALEHLDADNQSFANLSYKIFFENNQTIEGKLDQQGKAYHENVPDEAIKVEYEENTTIKDEPWDTYDSVLAQLSNFEK